MFQESFKDVSQKFKGCFKNGFKKEYFKDIQRLFQGIFKGVLRVF